MKNQPENDKKVQNPDAENNSIAAENGLDHWNNRLDENLEPKAHNDLDADEKAKAFSEKYGSGDQSDNI